MFQYTVGRALSLARGVPLRLDTQDFEGYALHNGFELHRIFNIDAQTASASDLRQVLGWRSPNPIRRRLFRKGLQQFRGSNLFVDSECTYQHQIVEVPDDCYLMGNWQSERYFEHVADTIRADFSFKSAPRGLNAELAAQLENSNAISLHVRRGDIAANPASLAVHGLCSLDYYRRAVEYIATNVSKPVFLIFSDDMLWVRENLHLEFPCHYIEHNKGLESYNDMRLMSLCHHHIIANSSFSWWGAWLNPRKDKIVVAPERWFAAEFDSTDIVPSSWKRM
ncbi:MAG: alpha-1,2-fucosyltransferase [Pseudomonadota bacterium]